MKIRIADRTLCREENTFTFKEKIEIARQLQRLNVDAIELPLIENGKADMLFIRTLSSFVKESIVSVAVGMNAQGVEDAAAALSGTKKPRLRIEVPVSTVGMEYTCHKKADKMIILIKDLITLAKAKVEDVEFCALDAARAEKDVLREMIDVAINAGATTVTVCDSSAEMMPDAFGEFVKDIISGIMITTLCGRTFIPLLPGPWAMLIPTTLP